MSQNNNGFTLVELSIVLVIIGLIVGGVLVGQDLIFEAKIQQAIKRINNLESATAIFAEKYQYPLPGDFRNATTFIGGPNTTDGNSNGDFVADDMLETLQFFTHLGAAGLIEGDYDGVYESPGALPDDFFGAGYYAFPSDFLSSVQGTFSLVFLKCVPGDSTYPTHDLNLISYLGDNLDCGIGLDVQYAQPLDAKMDDGKPLVGKIGTWQQSGLSCAAGITGEEYDLSTPEEDCTTAISILKF